jgi:hypothetical protein
MLSSVAAACSSKLNLRQKRLRRARPQARLILLPNGEWMTNSLRSGNAVCVSPELGPLKGRLSAPSCLNHVKSHGAISVLTGTGSASGGQAEAKLSNIPDTIASRSFTLKGLARTFQLSWSAGGVSST